MSTKIVNLVARDIRFPTSRTLTGSDATNKSPDYSAAYVILQTDHPDGLEGHGMTFTIGEGNDICVLAEKDLSHLVVGHTLESFTKNMGEFWRHITSDSQLRWLGPEKGVIHLATAAIVNAVWDLYAKVEGKPLWRLLSEMSPEELVRCLDFQYITDMITPEEALSIFQDKFPTRSDRIQKIQQSGYPAYTSAAGWLGYSDDKLRSICHDALAEGWQNFKIKIGGDLKDDFRRAEIIRSEVGYDCKLMMDANQAWEISEAIENIQQLAKYQPFWIEEPTSPDDIQGYVEIAKAISPIKLATGEQCQNSILFKQFIRSGGIHFCQIDACRLGGVNEVLAVLLMAAKFGLPICPHGGGVGLPEYVQHLSIFDYICVSGTLENRFIEYVEHLHENFLDPVTIQNGHYMPPSKPGFSIQMKPESLDKYEYPKVKAWQ
ncbi:L-fuconate dehydratase [Anabaena sp. PCC 7108]|uniref:L-fuconate dehydratase n=1 Tax=Anabaena sp. PCC 7108 TaxID=163908 RepID=UPI000344A2CA|nr:L-fuconate dehydratase [Anabaena sp. PCC 7108]